MRMNKAVICILVAMVAVTPCILDVSSTEPSPLGTLITAALGP